MLPRLRLRRLVQGLAVVLALAVCQRADIDRDLEATAAQRLDAATLPRNFSLSDIELPSSAVDVVMRGVE